MNTALPRPGGAIGSPPQPDQAEIPARGTAVALALVGHDARAPERHGNRRGAGREPALGAVARAGAKPQSRKSHAIHCSVIANIPGERRKPNAVNHLLFYACMLYCAQRRAVGGPHRPEPMSNARKILIVDAGKETRDALFEQPC